jgi:hypothetical protein
MFTVTVSFVRGTAGDWLARATDTGLAEVFITAIMAVLFVGGLSVRKE